MFAQIIVPVLGALSNQAAVVAFDAAVKLVTPPNMKSVAAFSLKIGAGLVGAILASKLSDAVTGNVESIFETIDPDKTVVVQEDPSTKPKNNDDTSAE